MATNNDFIVKNGLTVRNTATIYTVDSFLTTSTNVVYAAPTLNLNFLKGTLDPRITFTRSSGATYVGSNGIVQYADVNRPRFDYNPSSVGTIRGLLIEEQRTNLIPYSQDQTQWAMNAAPNNYYPTANAAIAPDGTPTATFILKPVTSGGSTVYKTWSGTTSTYYVGSIWLKAGGYSRASIIFGNTAFANINYGATVDLSTGSIISVINSSTVSLTSYANNWYRATITALSSSTTGNYVFAFYPLDNSNNAVWAGDGVSGIYSWGAQVETSQFLANQQTYATSYIPTVASQVTRSNDDAKIVGQSITGVWNQNNGTLFAEWMQGIQGSSTTLAGLLGVVGFTNPSAAGYNGYGIGINAVNSNPAAVVDLGRNQSNYSNVNAWPYVGNYINAGQIYKSVIAWDSNATYGMTDGFPPSGTTGAIATSSNTVVYNNFFQPCNTLLIGNQNCGGGPNYYLDGWVRRIQWWPATLSAAQIQSLTTTTTYSNANFTNATSTSVATQLDLTVKNGVVVSQNLEVPDVDKYYVTTLNRTSTSPSLSLNFLNGTLDPRISFTRASGATVIGSDSYIKYVGNNVPRFDYSTTSTGSCLGLLMEESRTNYMLNVGGQSGGTLAKNAGTAIGPDRLPAHKFTVSSTSTANFPAVAYGGTYSFTGATGTVVTTTFTGYFGPGFGSQVLEPHIVMQFSVGGASSVYNEVQINTTNWTIRQNSFNTTVTQITAPTITPAPGGMYKVSYTIKYTDDGTLRNLMSTYIQIRDITLSGTYASNGDSGIQYSCLQTEVGAFPTSYIPTEATTVTRAVDLATMSGQNFNSWINPVQGTLYLEADVASVITETPASYRWPLSISQTFGQKIGFHKPGNAIYAKIADDAYVSRFEPLIGNITANTTFKVALSYSSGSQLASLNYTNSATGTATIFPKFIDNLRIGNGDAAWCGHIRKIAYYPTALSTTATTALTII